MTSGFCECELGGCDCESCFEACEFCYSAQKQENAARIHEITHDPTMSEDARKLFQVRASQLYARERHNRPCSA